MFTRRESLGMIAAAAFPWRLDGKASQPLTAVDFPVPPGACDCHTHIYDPQKFPLWSGRAYTPEPAVPAEMAALHRALHIQRVVIVTAGPYGTDNSATLYGIKARGANARGIAVIDEHTTDSELATMAHGGIRGIRINANFPTGGSNNPALVGQRLRRAIERTQPLNWHVQINTNLAVIAALKDLLRDSPVPVVFDHFGGTQAALGLNQPGFADLVELVRSAKAYVKISAAYRVSDNRSDYSDVAPFAKALIAANAERILWGSDWPHPNTAAFASHKPDEVTPFLQIDDGRVMNLLPVWAPNPSVRKTILVDSPARLYGF